MYLGASEMIQWGGHLLSRLTVLSFIPRTNIVEEENQLLQVVFRLPYGCHGVSAQDVIFVNSCLKALRWPTR